MTLCAFCNRPASPGLVNTAPGGFDPVPVCARHADARLTRPYYNRVLCRDCGEDAPLRGSVAARVHRWGPTGHDFRTAGGTLFLPDGNAAFFGPGYDAPVTATAVYAHRGSVA